MNFRIYNIKKYRLRNLFRIEKRRLPFHLQYNKVLVINIINTIIEIRYNKNKDDYKLFNAMRVLQNGRHKRNNNFKK